VVPSGLKSCYEPDAGTLFWLWLSRALEVRGRFSALLTEWGQAKGLVTDPMLLMALTMVILLGYVACSNLLGKGVVRPPRFLHEQA